MLIPESTMALLDDRLIAAAVMQMPLASYVTGFPSVVTVKAPPIKLNDEYHDTLIVEDHEIPRTVE